MIREAFIIAKKLMCRIYMCLQFIMKYNLKEAFEGVKSIRAIQSKPIQSNKVLIVEPNEFHAEILPGYVHYFIKLGYQCVLLMRYKNAASGVFTRMKPSELPEVYVMNARQMRRFLKKCKPNKFSGIMITSFIYGETGGYYGSFDDFVGPIFRKLRHMTIVHSLAEASTMIKDGAYPIEDYFLLTAHHRGDDGFKMINPHYFGKYNRHDISKIRTFIVVGNVQLRNSSFRELADAVAQLERNGFYDFEVKVIGRGVKPELFKGLSSRIIPMGYLGFEELYDTVELADFFMPLLDPDDQLHKRFLHGDTTGAVQLILGFLKPPLLHEYFGKVYQFNDKTAVLHSTGGLFDAMLRAMQMNSCEYTMVVEELATLAASIENNSLKEVDQWLRRE